MKFRINRYAAEELKEMLPFLAAAGGAAAAVCAVPGFIFGFDWKMFSGLAVGCLLMLANFVIIGCTVEKAVQCRDFRRARSVCGISYGLRYIGLFAILAALTSLGAIQPIPAVIPLFFPKIYYTFFYVRKHGKDDEI